MPAYIRKKGGENIASKRNQAVSKYKKKTYKFYQLRLRKDTEKDIIDKIESQEQKNAYIISCLKKDL